MGAHTPGPWIWRGKSGSLHQVGEPPYTYGEAVLRPVYEYDTGTDVDVSEADADLIAAAPDLLAALRKAEEHIRIRSGNGETDLRADLNAALAKAEGRPS